MIWMKLLKLHDLKVIQSGKLKLSARGKCKISPQIATFIFWMSFIHFSPYSFMKSRCYNHEMDLLNPWVRVNHMSCRQLPRANHRKK